jgi:hypothetical protein
MGEKISYNFFLINCKKTLKPLQALETNMKKFEGF